MENSLTFYSLLAFVSQFLDHLAKCEQAAIDIAAFFETCTYNNRTRMIRNSTYGL